MYQHAKPWAYDFSRFSDFQLRDALLKLFAAGELRIWQLTEGWGQPPEGNGIGEGGLVMTGSSAAPGTTYKKVLQPGGAADTESIGVVDAAIGVVDLMATGLVNTGVDIVAGGAGLVTLAISGGDVGAAAHTIESVQEKQIGPLTGAGEKVAGVVAPVVDKYYEQNMAAVGEKTLEVTDSPLLAMAAHKSVELVGTVLGAGVVGKSLKNGAKVDGIGVRSEVPNKTSARNITGEISDGLKHGKFSVAEVNGRKVYKNAVDVTPNVPESVHRSVHKSIRQKVENEGWTNLDLMRNGYAPIGPDGKQINLHHVLGQEPGPMVELTTTIHKKYHKPLHGLIEDGRSFRNDPSLQYQYETFRKDYWKLRAKDFE